MCLKMYKVKEHVATEDMVCYKFLRVLPDKTLVSPYQEFKYELGVEYSAECTVYASDDDLMSIGVVEEGLHTLKHADNADYYARLRSSAYFGYNSYAIVECVIPKGATYYKGYWRGCAAYASNKLKAIKVIESIVPEEK